MNFIITTEHGRIGPFWWVNSDLISRQRHSTFLTRRWGTFGFGRTIRLKYEADE